MEEQAYSKRNFWAMVAEKASYNFAISFAGPYTVLTALASQLTSSALVIGSITNAWNGALSIPVIFVAHWIRNRTERMSIIRRFYLGRAVAMPIVAAWLVLSKASDPILTLAVLIAGMLLGYYNYPLDWCPDNERPKYMALLSIVSATFMVVPLIGGVIAQSLSYSILFGITAGLVLTGAFVGFGLPDMRMRRI